MGDRETQTQQEPAWWAYDDALEDSASSPSFDEPLQWPDALAWESLFEGGPETQPVYVPEDFGVDLVAPEATKVGDGGGPATGARLPPLPASIWAPDPADDDGGDETQATMAALGGAATAVAAPLPAPTRVAESRPGRQPGPQWMRRFHVRHGSAAVVALACCVSLVLLGMFLSVRARDELPTQTTQFEPTGSLATQGPTTSVAQPTTTATTTAPPPSISLSDLIPADAAAADAGGTSATTVRATAPATTAAPVRTTAPSGTSGGAAELPTNTTAAPDPEPTAPTSTSPPASDNNTTTPTSAPRVPTTLDLSEYMSRFTVPTTPSGTPRMPSRVGD